MNKTNTNSVFHNIWNFFDEGRKLFGKAIKNTSRQMLTSVVILIGITFLFAFIMWLAEHSSNPEFGYGDALIWNFVKYVSDPAEVADAPITAWGKIVGTLVGLLGIAIFAVPAGLIGSGLIDAMNDEKREKELQELRGRIRKAFLRDSNKALNNYLKGQELLIKESPQEAIDKDKHWIKLMRDEKPTVWYVIQTGWDGQIIMNHFIKHAERLLSGYNIQECVSKNKLDKIFELIKQ